MKQQIIEYFKAIMVDYECHSNLCIVKQNASWDGEEENMASHAWLSENCLLFALTIFKAAK